MKPSYTLAFPADRLFVHATRILDDAGARYGRAFEWTLGGGTVMAVRHDHRFSRDIDVFVPDPQHLGYLNPRLWEAAAVGDPDCQESAEYLKLRYPEGEVDFIVGHLLTKPGAQPAQMQGRAVRLETDIETVAKKLHHRGNRLAARDLFDLAFVLEHDPDGVAARTLAPWAHRHRAALKQRLTEPVGALRTVFATIDRRAYRPDFDAALAQVLAFVATLD